MTLRLIGDVHAKTLRYRAIAEQAEESIQVGDLGMGFLIPEQQEDLALLQEGGKHRFIRGNHDDPELCRKSNGWIKDGHFDADRNMMFIGGAWSIDFDIRQSRDRRYGGKTWWPDEEVALCELERIRADFVYFKPDIVITHDCPRSVAKHLFFRPPYDTRNQFRTRTSEALDAMFRDHKPDLWVFGHWHSDERFTYEGTDFVCLNELSYMDIEV
ncbi:metallophosphatase [Ruegeria phage RpAliso]|nr:metallophosphatase [Ruegeria phage RpAliso]